LYNDLLLYAFSAVAYADPSVPGVLTFSVDATGDQLQHRVPV